MNNGQQQPSPAPKPNDYLQTLYKLIPAEITAAYLVIYSVLNPLDSIGEPDSTLVFGTLFVSIAILAVFNYLAFPHLRNITRPDVRIYVSVTFLVWVLGTSVDFWIAFLDTFGVNVPHAIFLVVVILWGVGSVLFLHRGGMHEL